MTINFPPENLAGSTDIQQLILPTSEIFAVEYLLAT